MSDTPKPEGFLGAMTVADQLRTRALASGDAPSQWQQGDQNQWSVREMNPTVDAVGGPQSNANIADTRRVQQPAADQVTGQPSDEDPADKEKREKAEEFFRRKLFGDRPKKEDAKPKEDADPDANADDGEDNGGDKPKTLAKKTKVRKPVAGLTAADAETIASAAAAAAVKAIKAPGEDTAAATAKVESKPDLDGLDSREKEHYRVALKMAEENEERYKNLPKEIIDFGRRKKEYKAAWIKENAGRKFSWTDPEHADYLNSTTPDFDEHDFDRAETLLMVDEATKAERERTEERLREIEMRSMESSLGEKATEETKKGAEIISSVFAEDAQWDLATEEGRRKVLEEEPIVGDILANHAKFLDDANRELVKIFDAKTKDGRPVYSLDPKNPVHGWIQETVDRWEQTLAKADPEKTVNDKGQTFVTRKQYLSMPREKRDDYWSLFRDQTFYIVAKEIANQAEVQKKLRVDQAKALAERNGWKFNPDTIVYRGKKKSSPKAHVTNQPQKPNKDDSFGRPPSASSGGKVDTLDTRTPPSNEHFVDLMMSKLFPRTKS